MAVGWTSFFRTVHSLTAEPPNWQLHGSVPSGPSRGNSNNWRKQCLVLCHWLCCWSFPWVPQWRLGQLSWAGIPGLHGPLLLQRSELLRVHRQGSRVNDFGLPVAVGELQGAVPFPVRFADNSVGWVVFHFGCDPEFMNETNEAKGNSGSETFRWQREMGLFCSVAQRLGLLKRYSILDENKKRWVGVSAHACNP